MNVYKILRSIWSYDKKNESNRQMLTRIIIKFHLLFFIILMFDTLLDWFLGGIHFLFGLVHLLIESIEYIIEVILEQSLQTNTQQSDVIIVNGTIFIALYVLYRLYLATPTLCVRCKQMLCNFFSRWIRKESIYWKTLPLSQKINWTIYHVSGFSGLLFLLTL